MDELMNVAGGSPPLRGEETPDGASRGVGAADSSSDGVMRAEPPRSRSPGVSPEDRSRALFELHDRLRSSSNWIGIEKLCDHLERTTVWADYGNPQSRRRTVQNWLKRLRELPEGGRGFECREKAGAYEYRRDSRQPPPLASACMALLAERLLQPMLPLDYVQSDLEAHFTAARERVAEHERVLGGTGDAVGMLVERLAIVPRGQQLVPRDGSRDVAATVTGAILKRRRLEGCYGGRHRLLHPYGLILREPKFYLLAVENAALLADPDTPPKLFLCSRFDELIETDARNRVPDDFVVADWLDARGLDVLIKSADIERDALFELVLRIHGHSGNLVRDLVDFPLSDDQSVDTRSDADGCVLRAPNMRATEALLEWILGRAGGVEVIEPDFLRAAVIERVEAMVARYR